MGYHPYVVFTVLCWTAADASAKLSSQDFTPGEETKSQHVFMSVNPHGPIHGMQDSNATHSTHPLLKSRVGKSTKAVSGRKPSYIQKSSGGTAELSIFSGTRCKGEPVNVQLDGASDWTSSCNIVGLAWNKSDLDLTKVTAWSKKSAWSSTEKAQAKAKMTCEGYGDVVFYDTSDDGCMTHVSRFLLHKDQATLARSGKCIAASMELEGKDKGVISMMFTGISENTILPECFKESSCPSCPQWLVDKVGADNAWYFIIGGTVVGFLLLCLILYWAWRKLNPKQGQMSEDEAYEFNMQDRFQGAGKG